MIRVSLYLAPKRWLHADLFTEEAALSQQLLYQALFAPARFPSMAALHGHQVPHLCRLLWRLCIHVLREILKEGFKRLKKQD